MTALPTPNRNPIRSRRTWLRASLGVGVAAAGAAGLTRVTRPNSPSNGANPSAVAWRERVLMGFGTTLWLRAAHPDTKLLDRALDAAVAELRRIESSLSLFRANSDLTQLNAQGVLVNPDHRLVDLLRLANDISRDSGGAFDVSVQPLWALWHDAGKQRRIPSDQELRQARQRVGWQGIQIESDAIRLRPGMALTLNGIAQGYASDRARQVLVAHGIEQALLDTGEWTAMSRDYRAANWRLGLANPRARDKLIATLVADGRSVATSSDEHTYFTNDRLHHHIFDPFSGRSPASLASVTVLAASCAKADALTKVFFMADPDGAGLARRDASNPLIQAAIRLTRQWQVDALLVDKQGNWWGSSGLPLAG